MLTESNNRCIKYLRYSERILKWFTKNEEILKFSEEQIKRYKDDKYNY